MVKPLIVFKASAGSGKTFTLAVEYIKLLVVNPTSYRNILAVTFTNKATEEMKMRILSQLYGIWKQLPDSNSYLERIMKDTSLPPETVSLRAGEALHNLLHNYSYFRVETIDSFFQSVLRNLARELDLTANLRISLNDVQVEEQAVDQLIDSLTHSDAMLQWLLSYVMEKISDDRSWNIMGQVKQFGKTIFHDYYKTHRQALQAKIDTQGFIEEYTKQLRAIRQDALQCMKGYADTFFKVLSDEGIEPDQLAYGSKGIGSFFLKIQQGIFDESIVSNRVLEQRDDASKWYSKKSADGPHIHAVAEASLMPLLVELLDQRPTQWRLYQSADVTLQHLNQLRLLGSIEQKVRQMNDEANRFLLSDTQQFLHELISDSDSPFIFEKIGSQLEHIMIDEFQDTSVVQWKNFKVLLEECMSHQGTENLIVGDVKQSIYRWRSGDWRLLNAIDREFPHPSQQLDIEPLATNYRSERNIIAFNNAFFCEAARQEYENQRTSNAEGAEQLRHAYADVSQHWREGAAAKGYVDITLLPAADDYLDRTLQLTADTVERLYAQGVPLSAIAILTRTNKYIPTIAEYFAQHLPHIPVVSDEAFRLDSSVVVTLLVQALHLLTHPDDLLAKATIAKLYKKTVQGKDVAESELFILDSPLDDLLPTAFTQHTAELLQLPLYELVERLYNIFSLDRLDDQSAYLCTFYDQLSLFVQDNTTDIDAFVREWEDTISSKTIQGASANGIRILSIHKSKGLEFQHVIIPFCDWRLEHADIIWCAPDRPPFDALPIVPIAYSEKRLKGTIYEADYRDEHLQNTVDNLNLLYVAFTRAVSSLYVIGKRNEKALRSALIETVLPQLQLEGAVLEGEDDKEVPLTFTYGSPESIVGSADESATPSDNVFLQRASQQLIHLQTFDVKTAFRQSNESRNFIDNDDTQQAVSYIKMGNVLHEIFSHIRTTDDIAPALLRLQMDGVLYDDEVTREKLVAMLRKRLEDQRVSEWFSDRWQLFNECSILKLESDGTLKERRPDRVMTDGRESHVVDFKFGSPRAEYHEQIREYMQLLRQMGLPGVRGWLWYVYSNKIEEVKEA